LKHDIITSGSVVNVDFVRIDDQLGDIFTKSLSRVKFEEIRSRIGVQQIK
jgi:hypothetical protein